MSMPIEKRCQGLYTRAFVTAETVDPLAAKLIGIVGERRMTKMHRYLGDGAGVPDLYPGLRLWHGGYREAVQVKKGESVSIWLAGQHRRMDGLSFSVGLREETEGQARERYGHPEKQWLGERRDITHVVLRGRPGQPHPEDSIRIEYWNTHGVGQESLYAFDDLDLIEEIAWDVKGDRERQVHLWDEFCATHGLHFEHPDHEWKGCLGRQSTRAENLATVEVLECAAVVPDEAWEAAASVYSTAGLGFPDVARDAIRSAFAAADKAKQAEVEHADCFPPEQPRPPLHADNEAIVLGQYYAETARARREPRAFASDGPEPAEDVVALRDPHAVEDTEMPYLVRDGRQWRWSPSSALVMPDAGRLMDWSAAAKLASGHRLVEVSSS